jgi:hypothetical protein
MPQAQEAPVTQVQDGSSATHSHGVPSWVEPGIDDAPHGAVSVEMDGADPRLGDDVGSLRRDLVVHGTDPGTPRCIAPGDAVPFPGFSGAVGSGVAGLLLSGTPSSLSSPVNWGQVEDSAEQVCSQVVAVERLL